ncbi:MAG: hypothetical protein ACP5NS_03020 [Candidatus Pacearchaeota archaeon]
MERVEELKKSSGVPLFDIAHLDWSPSPVLLERYTRTIYDRLVVEYLKLELSQQYQMTSHVLIATGINSERDLAFCAGGGYTKCEAVCTHGMGWALKGLADKISLSPEPFNFRMFVVGYSGRNDGGKPQEYKLSA